MATTTSTTLSAALAADASNVYLTSATGVTAGTTLLYCNRELMKVTALSGTRATVRRGVGGTLAIAHASGTTVYVGSPDVFGAQDPIQGSVAVAAAQPYLPLIVPSSGKIWDVENSAWVEVIQDIQSTVPTEGTPVTGVTVREYGSGRNHLTKLTFSALTVDAIAAGAAEAIGKLLYTFPAGVIKVKSAYMSVGLTNTDGSIDADTPDMGLGTVIGTGSVSVLGGTATFEDILTGQTVNNCTGTAEVKTVHCELTIETGAAHTVHLNVADTWAAADTALKATGTVTLEWVLLPT